MSAGVGVRLTANRTRCSEAQAPVLQSHPRHVWKPCESRGGTVGRGRGHPGALGPGTLSLSGHGLLCQWPLPYTEDGGHTTVPAQEVWWLPCLPSREP